MKKLLFAVAICLSAQVAKPAPRPIDIGYTITLASATGLAWSYYKTWQLTKKIDAHRKSYEQRCPDFKQLSQSEQSEYLNIVMPLAHKRNTHNWAIKPVLSSALLLLSLTYVLNPACNPDLSRLMNN